MTKRSWAITATVRSSKASIALKSSGKDPAHLLPDDLAPVEFHTGGREATVSVADQMSLAEGLHLLDVGSGIGGPARYFAGHRHCTVTGVDLSPEYCDTAKELSAPTNLACKTSYHAASGAAMPFPGAIFDAAYMLHVGMNIPSKPRSYNTSPVFSSPAPSLPSST